MAGFSTSRIQGRFRKGHEMDEVMYIFNEIKTDTQYAGQNGAWSHVIGVIVNNMQQSYQALREIQIFGTFAMRDLSKLEVKPGKIIVDLRKESVVYQAEGSDGV
jgi:hypothetical protein